MEFLIVLCFLILTISLGYQLYTNYYQYPSLEKVVKSNSELTIITLTNKSDCAIKLDNYYFQSDYTCSDPSISKRLYITLVNNKLEDRVTKLQDIIYLRTGIRVPIKYYSVLDTTI